MIYAKLTYGWVAQHYDSETGDCVQQEFIPDTNTAAQRVDDQGQPLPEAEASEMMSIEKECAMDMVQP